MADSTVAAAEKSGTTAAAPAAAKPAKPGGGLEGVVAAKSEICFIDGNAGKLIYRGYDIADLVENATFEEVAFLLWDGKLPNKTELATLKKQLGESASLPEHVTSILRTLPRQTQPMDALRTAASALGATDLDLESNEPDANRRKAVRLMAQFPTIVTTFHRLRNGEQPVAPDPSLSVAAVTRAVKVLAFMPCSAWSTSPASSTRVSVSCGRLPFIM